jgi:putative membrane protein
MSNLLHKILQGAFIGVALILPGLSAGTVILILGFYRKFIDDLSNFRLRPYLPMLLGILAGVLAAVYAIRYLLDNYAALIMGLLLGLLLASIPAVLNYSRGKLKLKLWPVLLAAGGFYLTWFIICDPSQTFTVFPPGGPLHFFIGGTLSSATMLLPGVSGSSVLIIINLYDDVIYAVTHWQWLKLAYLAAGFVVGLFGLARLLSALYRRYQTAVTFLLAGLILGSTRVLLPEKISLTFILAAIVGAVLVLYLTLWRRKSSSSDTSDR